MLFYPLPPPLCCLHRQAYARIGNAYYKEKNWGAAIEAFESSLAESHDPEVYNKKRKAIVSLQPLQCHKYLLFSLILTSCNAPFGCDSN